MVNGSLRLVFLGTPQFAVPALEAIAAAGHDVALVVTQPDRPKGRQQETAFSPVKQKALDLGLNVYQPERIRKPEAKDTLAAVGAEAMVVVGYGQILPQAILDLAPLGIINVHASLLPKYRGAGPVQWAIALGETVTGVTTMRIDAGLDTGDVLLAEETQISETETAIELAGRLAEMGAALLVKTLAGIAQGTITPRPQDHAEATYAPMLKKEDGLLDWTLPARALDNRIRAFQPWPGCYTRFRGSKLHIWKARVASPEKEVEPGRLLAKGNRLLAVCGGNTALELIEVQLEGRKKMPAAAFLNGQRLLEYEILGEQVT